jgi:hypothetical protein
MKTNIYLIVNSAGSAHVRQTKPALDFDEIAIKLALEVPDVMFKKPVLEARIMVDEKIAQPTKITPDVLVNTKELIEQATGMKIDLRVIEVPSE